MADQKTLKLKEPLKIGKNEFKKVTIFEPKTSDLGGLLYPALAQGHKDQIALLIPRISEPQISEKAFNRMGVVDSGMIILTVMGFFHQVVDWMNEEEEEEMEADEQEAQTAE